MSVVVLPQPDSPTSPSVSPVRMSSDTPSTAWTVPMRRLNTAPFVSGNDFTSPSTRSTSGRSSRGTASRAFVCTGGSG